MLREGDPSHALTPKANRTERNRDRIPFLVCVTRATERIPPIGGYGALPAWAFARRGRLLAKVWRSQIYPKHSGNSKRLSGAAS